MTTEDDVHQRRVQQTRLLFLVLLAVIWLGLVLFSSLNRWVAAFVLFMLVRVAVAEITGNERWPMKPR